MYKFKFVITQGSPEVIKVVLRRLAMATGYSAGHICHVLKQDYGPSLKCLRKMAKVLGLGIDECAEYIREGRIQIK